MSGTMSGPIQHNVGKCPACRGYLWADVWVTVEVGEPTLTKVGEGRVYASAKPSAMRLHHECDGETIVAFLSHHAQPRPSTRADPS